MIGRYEATRGDLRVEEVLRGTGEELEQMKKIQQKRKKKSSEEANDHVERRKLEGLAGHTNETQERGLEKTKEEAAKQYQHKTN